LVSNSGERVLDSLGGDGRRAGAFVRASVTEWKYLCVMPSPVVWSLLGNLCAGAGNGNCQTDGMQEAYNSGGRA
jgi:hypothetical protein